MRWEVEVCSEHMAEQYVETLNSQPNGLGQHIHKETGLYSHEYFSKMVRLFGYNVTNHKIDRELAKRRESVK